MRWPEVVRRFADVTVALFGLVVTAPILAVCAGTIRVTEGRPVVFRQRRLGRGGHPFELLKFRTMRHATPGRDHPDHDADRVTRLGRWMRLTSIDELPSLVNLLRGDVTLVGPRPLPVHYWSRFRASEYTRFLVRPGITGLAQISGRNLVDWDERLALDVGYVARRSLREDLRILLGTFPAVVSGSGVSAVATVTMHELPEGRV